MKLLVIEIAVFTFAVIIPALPFYLLGAIPFGVLLARAFRLPDPRTIGSGNIGATNMLRTGRRDIAALTLLLDAGKGAAAVCIVRYLHRDPGCPVEEGANCIDATLPMITALAAAAFGHMASPWLKFSGGKGVATILGGALAFSWPVGVSACAIWLLVYRATRYVSLASITALAIIPPAVGIVISHTHDAFKGVASALIIATACGYAIYKHRSNIARLRRGEEPKVELGRKG